MPTILLVNSNTSQPVTDLIAARAREAAAPGTVVRAVTAPFGSPYIASRGENTVAAHATLAALADHAEGCDAAVIAAFSDPGLAAARERSAVPVVGIAEAAMLTACMLGRRFAILTTAPRLVPTLEELILVYGLSARLASVRAVDRSALDVLREPDAVADALAALGRSAVADAGADVLILGGAPLAALRDRVARQVDAPVLDGVACGVRQAELLVALGVRPSGPGR